MEQWKLALVIGVVALGGVALGGWIFGTHEAQAQEARAYRECFFGRQESVDVNNEGVVQMPGRDHTVLVPPGWVVAGAGAGGAGYVLFCR